MKKYSREEIESGVWKIMCKYSWETTDEMHLDIIPRDAFDLDSIDFVEIVVDFENEFGISIPDNEVYAAAGWTVSELCDYVEEWLKERKK